MDEICHWRDASKAHLKLTMIQKPPASFQLHPGAWSTAWAQSSPSKHLATATGSDTAMDASELIQSSCPRRYEKTNRMKTIWTTKQTCKINMILRSFLTKSEWDVQVHSWMIRKMNGTLCITTVNGRCLAGLVLPFEDAVAAFARLLWLLWHAVGRSLNNFFPWRCPAMTCPSLSFT